MGFKSKNIIQKISKFNTDRVVSISAIIVSVGTLFMIFYQTNLVRKEQKASVMPSLQIGYSVDENDGNVTEAIFVINQGLGPAFIKNVRILKKDTVYNTSPYNYLKELENYNKNETTFINRIFEGTIISANHRSRIFEKRTDSTSKIILNKLFQFPYRINNNEKDNIDKAIIEIEYENVYGDKWTVQSNSAIPQTID